MQQEQHEDKLTLDKKRLIFRSWHRGTREIDLLLGRFADLHLPDFTAEQVALYDRMLKNSDPDLYNWMTGNEPIPPAEDHEVLQMLVSFVEKGTA